MITNEQRLTVSVKEAAIMLGISKGLAYQLARTGELPGVIKLGKKRMVCSRSVIEKLLAGDNGVNESREN
jgi:excisionase family DNA binding protein